MYFRTFFFCGLLATLLFCGVYVAWFNASEANQGMYFAIPADQKHFEWCINLIGSIYKHNFNEVKEVAVFNLGFTPDQLAYLKTIEKVTVHEIEKTNPYMFDLFKIREGEDRVARGWYSWKPVVIKQALDMFPYVLYLDSGVTIYGSLSNVFKHIRDQGYFLFDSVTNIKKITTQYVAQKLCMNDPRNQCILNKIAVTAGIQGLSRALYKDYVLPVYELTKDIRNFQDDGTAPGGFGWGRCDLTLYSIYAHYLNLHIFRFLTSPGRGELIVDNQKISMRLIDILNFTRENINLSEHLKYIQFKKIA